LDGMNGINRMGTGEKNADPGYLCPECGRRFTERQAFHGHLSGHSECLWKVLGIMTASPALAMVEWL